MKRWLALVFVIVGIGAFVTAAAWHPQPPAGPERFTFTEVPQVHGTTIRDDKSGREYLSTNGWIVELAPEPTPTPMATVAQGPVVARPVPVMGQPTPTPTAYRECPFCHLIFEVEMRQGEAYFKTHNFVLLPLAPNNKSRFVTCEDVYYRHIRDIVKAFTEEGAGKIIEDPQKGTK